MNVLSWNSIHLSAMWAVASGQYRYHHFDTAFSTSKIRCWACFLNCPCFATQKWCWINSWSYVMFFLGSPALKRLAFASDRITWPWRHIHQQKNTLFTQPCKKSMSITQHILRFRWSNLVEKHGRSHSRSLSFRIMSAVRLDKSLYKHSRNLVTNLWLLYHVLGEPTYLMLRQGKSHLQNAKLPAEKGYNHGLQTFGIHGNPLRLCPRYVFPNGNCELSWKPLDFLGEFEWGVAFLAVSLGKLGLRLYSY